VEIILIEQGYKSIESWQDYKTGTGTTCREKDIYIDIGKAKDNSNKDGKPKCFNYNIYEHIAKEY